MMAIIARFFLFFQMGTVFPLLIFIFRVQFLYIIFKVTDYPGFLHVLLLNGATVTVCTIVAITYPKVREPYQYILILFMFFVGGRYNWMVRGNLWSRLYFPVALFGNIYS